MGKLILVLASKAKDHIYDPHKKTPTVREGGPAFYIEKALQDLGAKHKVAKVTPAEIEIKLLADKETGRIARTDTIEPPVVITEPYLLISTIGPNSLNLELLDKYQGGIFLDIQGFVRQEGGQFGAKRFWEESLEIVDRLTVLKGNTEEIACLPPAARERSQSRILIETQGNKGATIWETGRKMHLRPPRIVKSEDTIGAGDTFMAAFVCEFIRVGNALAAGEFALDYTCRFLEVKSRKGGLGPDGPSEVGDKLPGPL